MKRRAKIRSWNPIGSYVGARTDDLPQVFYKLANRAPMFLPARLDLSNHSPDGFNWGYSGSGPAQLALAILAHCTGDDDLACELHQDFKREFVAKFEDAWTINASAVRAWVQSKGWSNVNPTGLYVWREPGCEGCSN